MSDQRVDKPPLKNDSLLVEAVENAVLKDSIKGEDTSNADVYQLEYRVPDFFLFTKEEVDKYKNQAYTHFTSSEQNFNLFVEPNTDGSITTAVLCRNFNVPTEYRYVLAPMEQNLKGKIIPVQLKKIQTIQGISIDSKIDECFDIFGKPDSVAIKNGIEILKWNFRMQETDSKLYDFRKLQPFVIKDLDFMVEIRFKKKELIALVYRYEVP